MSVNRLRVLAATECGVHIADDVFFWRSAFTLQMRWHDSDRVVPGVLGSGLVCSNIDEEKCEMKVASKVLVPVIIVGMSAYAAAFSLQTFFGQIGIPLQVNNRCEIRPAGQGMRSGSGFYKLCVNTRTDNFIVSVKGNIENRCRRWICEYDSQHVAHGIGHAIHSDTPIDGCPHMDKSLASVSPWGQLCVFGDGELKQCQPD